MIGRDGLASAMQALRDDRRWQNKLSEEERALCLRVVERRLADSFEQAFTSAHNTLVSISHILARARESDRMDVLRALLE